MNATYIKQNKTISLTYINPHCPLNISREGEAVGVIVNFNNSGSAH